MDYLLTYMIHSYFQFPSIVISWVHLCGSVEGVVKLFYHYTFAWFRWVVMIEPLICSGTKAVIRDCTAKQIKHLFVLKGASESESICCVVTHTCQRKTGTA